MKVNQKRVEGLEEFLWDALSLHFGDTLHMKLSDDIYDLVLEFLKAQVNTDLSVEMRIAAVNVLVHIKEVLSLETVN